MFPTVLDAIGSTPLVKLQRLAEDVWRMSTLSLNRSTPAVA